MIKINGKTYDLLFNGAAMFAIRDKFETDNITELITENTALAFQRACKIAVIMAEQAELARRWLGHTARDMLTEEELLVSVSPLGIMQLKTALVDAMLAGYKRENNDDEIDIGLTELNKKKAT